MSRGVRDDIEKFRARESHGVIVECDQMEDGDQIWFRSAFEAEHACYGNDCCKILPAPRRYDGPLFYSDGVAQ